MPNNPDNCSITNKQVYIDAIETNEELFLQTLVKIQEKLYSNPTDGTINRDVSSLIANLNTYSNEIIRNINLLKECPINNDDIQTLQDKSKNIEILRNKLQNNVAEINHTNESIIAEKENENKKWLYLNISLSLIATTLLIYGFSKIDAKQ
ncbi:MAG: hypothetical protein EBU01_13550 [Crocinitomicaceae bacterium]|nr:hypothetical protein [Crocinitomicaceae bacterium]